MITKTQLSQLAKTLNGMPILGTLAGSPAQRLGCRYGDVLLEVNGKPVYDVPSFVEAKSITTDGMTALIFRDGMKIKLEMTYDKDRVTPDPNDLVCELSAMRILGGEPETVAAKPQAN